MLAFGLSNVSFGNAGLWHLWSGSLQAYNSSKYVSGRQGCNMQHVASPQLHQPFMPHGLTCAQLPVQVALAEDFATWTGNRLASGSQMGIVWWRTRAPSTFSKRLLKLQGHKSCRKSAKVHVRELSDTGC